MFNILGTGEMKIITTMMYHYTLIGTEKKKGRGQHQTPVRIWNLKDIGSGKIK